MKTAAIILTSGLITASAFRPFVGKDLPRGQASYEGGRWVCHLCSDLLKSLTFILKHLTSPN